MEFADVVRRRRMVRTFRADPIPAEALDRVLDTARRAPSAGFSQGLDLIVLEGAGQTGRYWAATFPDDGAREAFRWQTLFDAPVLVLVVVNPATYTARYGEVDKAATGLGEAGAWAVPYWWVDGGAAAQNLLLAAVDEGLGALLFGAFDAEPAVLQAFGAPPGHRLLGTVALGHPAADEPGRSATRRRRTLDEVVHRSNW